MAFSLFKRDFNKPGPGVPKNAPRKKGFARFFELLGRDFGNLVKLNLFYQLCVLPSQVLLVLAIIGIGTAWYFIFGIPALAACVLVGPAKTALSLCVSKMLRDDPGFAWHDFKKAFKENFKPMALPGVIYGLIIGAQVTAVVLYLSGQQANFVLIALFFFSVLVFAMASPYFFLQAGYLQLGGGGLLKNSILLSLAYVPRSLMGALLGGGLVLVQAVANVLFYFVFIPISAIVGYAIPCLLSLMWIWPPVDKTFKIEATLKARENGEPDPPLGPAAEDDAEVKPNDELPEDEDEPEDEPDEDGDSEPK